MGAIITTFMQQDHDRLNHMLKECRIFSKAPATASEVVSALKNEVERHIAWEEHILFPVFEQRLRAKEHGPTAAMRKEHCRIKEIVEHMHACAVAGKDFEAHLLELVDTLNAHTAKEEEALYPWIDNRMGEDGAMKLIASMKAMPEAEYASPGAK
jgi:iron-sulfur cluster repair protein YtfE (RIC family)